MNYQSLAAELALPAYSGLTDQQAADLLNDPVVAVKQKIETRDIQKYLILSNKLLQIEASADPAALMTKRALDIFETFDMADPLNEGALIAQCDGLIAAGLIDAADKAVILSLGDNVVSRASQLGSIKIYDGDVQQARAL